MEKRSFTLRLPADLDKALKELARSSNQTSYQRCDQVPSESKH